jgi:hypothetical protein
VTVCRRAVSVVAVGEAPEPGAALHADAVASATSYPRRQSLSTPRRARASIPPHRCVRTAPGIVVDMMDNASAWHADPHPFPTLAPLGRPGA